MCIKHIDGKGYNRDTDLAEIEFLMFFRFPYLRSERLQMKKVSESDTNTIYLLTISITIQYSNETPHIKYAYFITSTHDPAYIHA